jgi:hypothetical protein
MFSKAFFDELHHLDESELVKLKCVSNFYCRK